MATTSVGSPVVATSSAFRVSPPVAAPVSGTRQDQLDATRPRTSVRRHGPVAELRGLAG
ncbi:hypothetical protein Q5762_22600 [Streptomyces sp. P9(2023)]|uniref:hypothetical protein n=1 Tax=Streptomyces sp. P9(2023) TaxID=3064394 RepID=UPI0028F443D6|nr:hypothetical protein [Streptomyces sp. P9(2023)]MDT9691088.1 hypothetical protein [Streptomyces sp. P9(2023)]